MLYTQEHLELQRSVKKFIETEINPHVDAWEAAEIFPAHELFKKMGDAGFLGINKPQEYGGMGLDYSFQLAFVEALGDVNCGGVPMAIGVQTDMATPALARFGSDELRREFLAPTIAGDYVCSIGVSEPGAGSDVASIKTFAKKDGDDYVITGTKMWITSGTQSDWICLLANTSEGAPHKNKTLICVPMKTKGVSVAKKLKKLGMWSSDTAQLYFDEVRVPQRYRIGEEGMGFTYQMQQFQEERLFAAAQWTVLDRILRETIAYTRERQAFGQSILDNQYVHFRLAELKTEVEALARAGARRRREAGGGRGRHHAGLDGQAEGRPPRPRGRRRLPAVLGRHGLHVGIECLARAARRAPLLHRRRRRRGDARHHQQIHGHAAEEGMMRRHFLPPLPASGERAGVRGRRPLPLTLTLSPLAGRGEVL